jgi:hypothetical protein
VIDKQLFFEVDLRVGRARKSLLTVGDKPGLVCVDGHYAAGKDNCCTVLESLVLDEPYTGDLKVDAAKALGTTVDWIDGFIMGHAIRYSNAEIRRLHVD